VRLKLVSQQIRETTEMPRGNAVAVCIERQGQAPGGGAITAVAHTLSGVATFVKVEGKRRRKQAHGVDRSRYYGMITMQQV
jgi:hypothetical protein